MTLSYRSTRSMGSEINVWLDEIEPSRAAARPIRWFRSWSRQLSRFDPESGLSKLNEASGARTRVSRILWEVLRASLWGATWSEGLVIPTLLPALEAAGYDRSFEKIPATGPFAPTVSDQRSDWQCIALFPATREVLLPPECRLDFGGIAKGWAADRAVRLLRQHGPALVDAGGDISISGPRLDGRPWAIDVPNIGDDSSSLGVLSVESGGIATSGSDRRTWSRGGVSMHHIIDPRTAGPARTDVVRCTVVAPSATVAEVCAKTVLLLGSERGMEFVDRHPGLAALIVTESKGILASDGMSRFFEPVGRGPVSRS